MGLKPYDQNAKCPKCNSDSPNLEYKPEVSIAGVEFYDAMEKTCRKCAYVWYEACADMEFKIPASFIMANGKKLPIVWLDKIPVIFGVVSIKEYHLICPHCDYDGDSMQFNLANEIVAIEVGYDYACRGCGKDYHIRIRIGDVDA